MSNKMNIVRSIKFRNIREQDLNSVKEIGWDDRFHLGKLSSYDICKDFNYRAYLKNKSQMETKIKSQAGKNFDYGFNIPGRNLNYYNNEIFLRNEDDNLADQVNNEQFIEELNVIQSLWDDLGVTDTYKIIFESICRDLDNDMKKDLLDYEMASLKKFSDALLRLAKEVQNREKTINMLYQYNESILKEEFNEKTLNEVVHCIKNVRILSINIVNHLSKIRELSSYNVLGGKYDLDKINKIYLFDRNYLIKMKYDLDFLKNSRLANFYEIDCEESDPFLIFIQFKSEINEKKYFIKCSNDILNSIRQSQFLILQDLIFYHIYNINLQKNNSTIRSCSPKHSKMGQSGTYRDTNFKKALGNVIKLYSPPKNFSKKNDSRPHSSNYRRKRENNGLGNNLKYQNFFVVGNKFENRNKNFYDKCFKKSQNMFINENYAPNIIGNNTFNSKIVDSNNNCNLGVNQINKNNYQNSKEKIIIIEKPQNEFSNNVIPSQFDFANMNKNKDNLTNINISNIHNQRSVFNDDNIDQNQNNLISANSKKFITNQENLYTKESKRTKKNLELKLDTEKNIMENEDKYENQSTKKSKIHPDKINKSNIKTNPKNNESINSNQKNLILKNDISKNINEKNKSLYIHQKSLNKQINSSNMKALESEKSNHVDKESMHSVLNEKIKYDFEEDEEKMSKNHGGKSNSYDYEEDIVEESEFYEREKSVSKITNYSKTGKSKSKVEEIDLINSFPNSKKNKNDDEISYEEDIYNDIEEEEFEENQEKKNNFQVDKNILFEKIEDEINYDFEVDKPMIEGTLIENPNMTKENNLEIIKEESLVDKSHQAVNIADNRGNKNDKSIIKSEEKSMNKIENFEEKKAGYVLDIKNIKNEEDKEKKGENYSESFIKKTSKSVISKKSLKSKDKSRSSSSESKSKSKSSSSSKKSQSELDSKKKSNSSILKENEDRSSFMINRFDKSEKSDKIPLKENMVEESLSNIDIGNDESHKNKTSSLNNTKLKKKNFIEENDSKNLNNINNLFKREFDNQNSSRNSILENTKQKKQNEILKSDQSKIGENSKKLLTDRDNSQLMEKINTKEDNVLNKMENSIKNIIDNSKFSSIEENNHFENSKNKLRINKFEISRSISNGNKDLEQSKSDVNSTILKEKRENEKSTVKNSFNVDVSRKSIVSEKSKKKGTHIYDHENSSVYYNQDNFNKNEIFVKNPNEEEKKIQSYSNDEFGNFNNEMDYSQKYNQFQKKNSDEKFQIKISSQNKSQEKSEFSMNNSEKEMSKSKKMTCIQNESVSKNNQIDNELDRIESKSNNLNHSDFSSKNNSNFNKLNTENELKNITTPRNLTYTPHQTNRSSNSRQFIDAENKKLEFSNKKDYSQSNKFDGEYVSGIEHNINNSIYKANEADINNSIRSNLSQFINKSRISIDENKEKVYKNDRDEKQNIKILDQSDNMSMSKNKSMIESERSLIDKSRKTEFMSQNNKQNLKAEKNNSIAYEKEFEGYDEYKNFSKHSSAKQTEKSLIINESIVNDEDRIKFLEKFSSEKNKNNHHKIEDNNDKSIPPENNSAIKKNYVDFNLENEKISDEFQHEEINIKKSNSKNSSFEVEKKNQMRINFGEHNNENIESLASFNSKIMDKSCKETSRKNIIITRLEKDKKNDIMILSTKNIINVESHPDLKISGNISRIQHIKTEIEEKNNSLYKLNKEELHELNSNFRMVQENINENSKKLNDSQGKPLKNTSDNLKVSVVKADVKQSQDEIQFKKNTSYNNKSNKSNIIDENSNEGNIIAATPPPEKKIVFQNSNKKIRLTGSKVEKSVVQTNRNNSLVNLSQGIIDKQKNFHDFKIVYACDLIEIFQEKYSKFYEKINQEQRIAFKLNDSIHEYMKGYNPRILTALNTNGEIVAVCCVQYDSLYDNNLRLYLKNILCINYEFFELFSIAFLKFILNNFVCEEIYIDLYYEFKGGNFQVNEYILDVLKKSLGFKWTKLENKIGERYQKMCIKVKSYNFDDLYKHSSGIMNSIESHNPTYNNNKNILNFSINDQLNNSNLNSAKNNPKICLKKFKFNMEILTTSIIRLKNNSHGFFDPAGNSLMVKDDNFEENVNFFMILHSLLNVNQTNEFKIHGELINKMDFEKFKRLSKNFVHFVFKSPDNPSKHSINDISNSSALINDLNSTKIKEIMEKLLTEDDVFSSFMNLNLKFVNNMTMDFNGILYNRIEGNIEILVHPELNHQFFVIMSGDGNNTIIVTEIDGKFEKMLNSQSTDSSSNLDSQNKSIYLLFSKLYTQLNQNSHGMESTMISRSLWLPCFKKSEVYGSNNLKNSASVNDIFQLEIIKNSEVREIGSVEQYMEIELKHDINYNTTLKIEPTINDIVIKNSFMISIINLDILSETNIPTIFTSAIDTSYFVKKS